MRDRREGERVGRDARAEALVFAVAHEVGNLLAAVRLEAHLLDEQGGKSLAAAAVQIEDLADRAGLLLALVRPLLEGGFGTDARASPEECLAVVRRETAGWARGVALSVEVEPKEPPLPSVRADASALQALLCTWVADALEAARPRGRVRLTARADGDAAVFELEDDGAADDDPDRWSDAPLRGRALGVGVAAHLAARVGGRVDAARVAGKTTRLRLLLPAAP